jgi:hypothetical protein
LTAAIDRAPVLIAQHMPPTFTAVLAEHLKGAAGRDAHEGEDGEPVLAGGIYVAPGGRHVRVVRGPGGVRIALGDDPPSISASRRWTLCSHRRRQHGAPATSRSCSPAWAPTVPAAPRILLRRAAA